MGFLENLLEKGTSSFLLLVFWTNSGGWLLAPPPLNDFRLNHLLVLLLHSSAHILLLHLFLLLHLPLLLHLLLLLHPRLLLLHHLIHPAPY